MYDEAPLLRHIKTLSSDAFEGRRTDTKGALKARKYIINQFHSLKVLPFGNMYEQPFSFINRRKQYHATNILGLIKGAEFSKKYIVISAHYDHEGIKQGEIYNGADDNASGISALFAFAEYFKKNPPKHSVILAAFDGEELGLQGSKHFVNSAVISIKNIVANLNMDMISRSTKNELFAVGTPHNKRLKYIIKHFECSNKIKLKIGHDGYDGLDNWTYSSDHANFHKKGIPFLYFGVEDHKDYHEPTDDYENIDPEFYVEAVKTIISVFQKIDSSKI
ncbi:M20/M25/M40 family metallo-hydrolase [Flaviramulus aquimarinus]|uniref:M20/M25/M40 family metallo-hydrolase n=1 Tax=Flaviramulus aquimarinus TaxID=1170456 RepID=A0ABP9EXY9_9FLAO